MKNIGNKINSALVGIVHPPQIKSVPHIFAFLAFIMFTTVIIPTSDAAENYIWVANSGSNTVSKVDTTTNSVATTIPVGAYPYAVAVAKSHVFVANRDSKSISMINKSSDLVDATITLDRYPLALSLGADGYLYAIVTVNTNGSSFSNTAYIYRIDPMTYSKVDELELIYIAELDVGIGVNGENIAYIPYNYSPGARTGVLIVDLNTFTVKGDYSHSPWTYGYLGPGIAIDSDGNGWVSGIRYASQQCIIKITPTGQRSFYRPIGIREELVIDPSGFLWAGNYPNPLVKFNIANSTYTTYPSSGWSGGQGTVSGLTYLNGYIWVVDRANNFLRKIDPTNGNEVAAITVGSSPYSIGDISGYEASLAGLNVVTPSEVVALTLDMPYSGTVVSSGESHFYKLELISGGFFRVTLDDADDIGDNELYVKCGSFPNTYVYDFRSENPGSADQEVVFSTDQAGTCYIMASGVEASGDYSLIVSPVALGISDVNPRYYGNTQDARLTITGAGFDASTDVSIVAKDGSEYYSQSVGVDSFFQITTVFDLSIVPIGRYDVKAVKQGEETILINRFEVIETRKANLETHLVLPGRFGRHATATIYVEYRNTGNVAMPAPMLVLMGADPDGSDKPFLTLDSSKVIQNFWSASMPAGTGHTVQFLGDGDDSAPGILQPGESGRMPVYYSGLQQPWDFSDSQVEFEIRIVTTEETTPFDWDAAKVEFKPESIEQDAWEIIFANLANGVGPTWGDYIAMLSENADYLYRHGKQHVRDINKLFQFEMLQAMGHSPVPYLAGQTDMIVSAPGLPLTFGRYFSSSINNRHKTGVLGRGWTHTWQILAIEDLDGNVIISRMNNLSRYVLDARGGYFSPTGDYTKLSKSAGIFTVTHPNGLIEKFRTDGKFDYLEDLNGNRITAEYTGSGLLNRLVHSSGQSISLTYNGSNRITGLSDQTGGLSVTYAYDSEYLALVTDVWGRSTEYAYHQGGASTHAMATVLSPNGTQGNFVYDANGRLSEMSRNSNPPVYFDYDIGAVIINDQADQSVREQFYDADGQFIKYQDPLLHTTNSEFDKKHQLTKRVLPDGSSVTLIYDKSGNVVQSKDQLQQDINFTYGSYNRLASIMDSESNTTLYNYDLAGNPESIVSPDTTSENYTADDLGNISQSINRRGTPINYTYDNSGRLLRRDYADLTFVEYAYDGVGNIVSVVDQTGTTIMTYYGNNLLKRITYPGNRFLEYGYDNAGRRTFVVDQTGYQLNYSYDLDGNLESIVEAGSGELVHYSYDAMQRLSRKDLGNGVYTTYAYDLASRLTNVTNYASDASILSRFDYGFDSLNRRTSMSTLDGAWTYTYDLTGQLNQADFVSSNPAIVDKTITYTYDKVGNRIQEVNSGMAINYTTNTMKQYSQAGIFTYSYDDDGNLIAKTDGVDIWSYNYNDENRLVTITGPEGLTEYHYNGLGHLTGVTENGITNQYLVDPGGLGNVVGEYDAAGLLLTRYAHGLGLVTKDDYFYTFDGSGNTSELTDGANMIVNSYGYEPFGKPLYSTESIDNDFQYVGQFGARKADDDLFFMRNRFYSAGLGRFISEDPIGLAGADVSFYRYVQNNPVNFVDPNGLMSFDFDQFASEVEERRFDTSATLGTLATTLGVGTMPKTVSESRWLGPRSKFNPYTSQLSRWSGRVGDRTLRDIGRTALGKAIGAGATGLLVFEGFYDWGVIGIAAYNAISFDDSECN